VDHLGSERFRHIGGAVCGDVILSFPVAAGTYTVLLTDALYYPVAVSETNGTLGDGFFDYTPPAGQNPSGGFQTCNIVGDTTTCIAPSANWALDITTEGNVTPAPEPGELWVYGIGLIGLGAARRRRTRPNSN